MSGLDAEDGAVPEKSGEKNCVSVSSRVVCDGDVCGDPAGIGIDAVPDSPLSLCVVCTDGSIKESPASAGEIYRSEMPGSCSVLLLPPGIRATDPPNEEGGTVLPLMMITIASSTSPAPAKRSAKGCERSQSMSQFLVDS